MTYDTKKKDFSREHIYVVEIDQRECNLSFATGDCNGGEWSIAVTSISGTNEVGDKISGQSTGAEGILTEVGATPWQYIVTNGIQFSSSENLDNDTQATTNIATTNGTPTSLATGDQKCYNTLATCQSFSDFITSLDTGTITSDVALLTGSDLGKATFDRSTGSFITDGFEVDDKITTSGYTNAENNGTFRIVAVTASIITVRNPNAVAETGGGNEQITGESIKTYRFCEARSPHPHGINAIPSVKSVSTSPAQIDIKGGLGVRSNVNVQFTDHPYSDTNVDPYMADRSYTAADSEGRGSFWTKWRVRNAGYQYNEMRLLSGYLEGDTYNPKNFQTRHYVMESMTATKGGATIKGNDPLKLATQKKAQAPSVSTGVLNAAITNSATSAVLKPTGIGNQEYSASGYLLIDQEVFSFTRTNDNLTFSGRGTHFNTANVEHAVDASVQECLYYQGATEGKVNFIVKDLLTNYASVDPSFIDDTGWAAEVSSFIPDVLDGIIVKPQDVFNLLVELAETLPHYLWWDERSQTIQLTALKPPPDSANVIDQDGNIIEDSLTVTDKPDMRISTVVVNYGQIDPTKKLDEFSNYENALVRVDTESIALYGTSQIKTINTRWIPKNSKTSAEKLSKLMGRRFAEVPREVKFSLDPKDSDGADGLWVGQTRYLRHRDMVGFNGELENTIFQIISSRETAKGFDFVGLEYRYGDLIGDETDDLIDVVKYSNDQQNVNLYDDFVAQWGTPTINTEAKFIVEAGVVIGSSSTATPAMDTGTLWNFSGGSGFIQIIIESSAYVVGRGGSGGSSSGGAGGAGGDAINIQEPSVIISNSGVIGGGGGGGGGATVGAAASSGGGGAGNSVGTTGGAGGANDGTLTTGGDGGFDLVEPSFEAFGGRGGNLGNSGSAGTTNGGGTTGGGGAAGKAIELNGNSLDGSSGTGDTRGAVS